MSSPRTQLARIEGNVILTFGAGLSAELHSHKGLVHRLCVSIVDCCEFASESTGAHNWVSSPLRTRQLPGNDSFCPTWGSVALATATFLTACLPNIVVRLWNQVILTSMVRCTAAFSSQCLEYTPLLSLPKETSLSS